MAHTNYTREIWAKMEAEIALEQHENARTYEESRIYSNWMASAYQTRKMRHAIQRDAAISSKVTRDRLFDLIDGNAKIMEY